MPANSPVGVRVLTHSRVHDPDVVRLTVGTSATYNRGMGVEGGRTRLVLPASWSIGPAGRTFASITFVAALVFGARSLLQAVGLLARTSDASSTLEWFWFGFAVFFAVFLLNWVIRPRLIATEDGVTMYNPVSTRVLRWDQIVSIRPTAAGLKFTTNEGTDIFAWAVQRPRIADPTGLDPKPRKWRTRADNIAAQLMVEVETRHHPANES